MEFNYLSILTVIFAITSIVVSLMIFKRLFNKRHKRPWLYIAISSLFIMTKEIIFSLNIKIINSTITEIITLLMGFISVTLLTFALILEYMIIKYYKGKFVRIKFIPVKEGTLADTLDLNISRGESYLAYQKDKNFLIEQFSKAIKTGFEGFLLTETPPKQIRDSFNVEKSPIGWLTQVGDTNSEYVRQNLTENSDTIDPININNIVSHIDLFLEEAETPFILIEINELLRINTTTIAIELLNYISKKITSRNGIFIATLTRELDNDTLSALKETMKDLE